MRGHAITPVSTRLLECVLLPRMKTLLRIVSAVFVLLPLSCLAADFITLQVPAGTQGVTRQSDPFSIAAGDAATLVYSSADDRGAEVEVTIGSNSTVVKAHSPASTIGVGPITIAGPATIRARSASGFGQIVLLTFSIQRANSLANATPASAVVIPEDASGQYQVILESSTDLITWAAANPGTYGGTTQKRFFRTRIVKEAP